MIIKNNNWFCQGGYLVQTFIKEANCLGRLNAKQCHEPNSPYTPTQISVTLGSLNFTWRKIE